MDLMGLYRIVKTAPVFPTFSMMYEPPALHYGSLVDVERMAQTVITLAGCEVS
jgi:hypothetical protein